MKSDKIEINFIDSKGTKRTVSTKGGRDLMNIAVLHDIPEIDGECAASCACATCHVYIDTAWVSLLKEKSDLENELLEAANKTAPNSRLSCQIKITERLDGLTVCTPLTQS